MVGRRKRRKTNRLRVSQAKPHFRRKRPPHLRYKSKKHLGGSKAPGCVWRYLSSLTVFALGPPVPPPREHKSTNNLNGVDNGNDNTTASTKKRMGWIDQRRMSKGGGGGREGCLAIEPAPRRREKNQEKQESTTCTPEAITYPRGWTYDRRRRQTEQTDQPAP